MASAKVADWLKSLHLDAPSELGADAVERAYLESAAVLSSFDPSELRPSSEVAPGSGPATRYLEPVIRQYGRTEVDTTDHVIRELDPWRLRLAESVEPVVEGGPVRRWRLGFQGRRTVLSQLGSRERIRAVLEANPDRPSDPVQRGFEALVSGDKVPIDRLSRDDLSGMAQAVEWLDGVVDDLPDLELLESRMERLELVRPLRKLVGDFFGGRQDALRRLRDYVGLIPADRARSSTTRFLSDLAYSLVDRPPLVIHGPGGIGKSTLVAKFILEHFESTTGEHFPFAYLNFDRAGLDAGQPLTLLIEAAWQLSVQFRRLQPEFGEFVRSATEVLSRQDALETDKSAVDWEWLLSRFTSLIDDAAPGDTPFVLVLDTFEEVQSLGEPFVDVMWDFLARLQEATPRLRPIMAGRAPIRRRLVKEEIELEDFEPETAVQILRGLCKELGLTDVDPAVLERTADTVGGNPLSLRLAARLIQEEGLNALKSLKTRRMFFLRMKSEQVQAILHGRILRHLHDKGLAKIAYPGLLVRRITPEVIEKVLAGPCKLELTGEGASDRLFDKLAKEVSLVERDTDDPEPRALRHRENVRKLMLEDLARVHEEIADAIHRAAVRYYARREGAVYRAEEIYHRLHLRQAPARIEERWEDGLDRYLRPAIPELKPKQRDFLATRLGVELDESVAKDAAQQDWERATIRRAETYLKAGDAESALEAMRRRDQRLPGSELYRLEVTALRQLGRLDEARKVAQRGLDSLSKGTASSVVIDLVLALSLIDEELGRLRPALKHAEDAEQLSDSLGDELDRLRVLVAQARILRKLGNERSLSRRRALLPQIVDRWGAASREVRDHPALFREVVAEIGDVDRAVLKEGIQRLGIDIGSGRQASALAGLLSRWESEIDKAEGKEGKLVLGSRAGLKRSKEPRRSLWTQWIEQNAGTRLTRFLVNAISEFEMGPSIHAGMVEQFQFMVDNAINRTRAWTPKRKRSARAKTRR